METFDLDPQVFLESLEEVSNSEDTGGLGDCSSVLGDKGEMGKTNWISLWAGGYCLQE